MVELTHTKNTCTADDLCLGGKDGLWCGNCGAGLREDLQPNKTIHGVGRQTWDSIHDDYKSVRDGVKYALVMDEQGRTVSMPYKEARARRLI